MDAIFGSLDAFLSSLEGVRFGGIEVTTLATWFAAGIVASFLLMGRRPIGRLGDMIVGVLGGLLGGWASETTGVKLSSLISGLDDGARTLVGEFLTAVAGAIVVLLILRVLLRRGG